MISCVVMELVLNDLEPVVCLQQELTLFDFYVTDLTRSLVCIVGLYSVDSFCFCIMPHIVDGNI
jgi:hypothetical protein